MDLFIILEIMNKPLQRRGRRRCRRPPVNSRLLRGEQSHCRHSGFHNMRAADSEVVALLAAAGGPAQAALPHSSLLRGEESRRQRCRLPPAGIATVHRAISDCSPAQATGRRPPATTGRQRSAGGASYRSAAGAARRVAASATSAFGAAGRSASEPLAGSGRQAAPATGRRPARPGGWRRPRPRHLVQPADLHRIQSPICIGSSRLTFLPLWQPH